MTVNSPYLTLREAAEYTRSASPKAFSEWYRRHGVPAYGGTRKRLFLARDLDEALQPTAQRGRRRHFASVRGGRV